MNEDFWESIDRAKKEWEEADARLKARDPLLFYTYKYSKKVKINNYWWPLYKLN